MKVNELRNILDLLDGESNVIVAVKSSYGDLCAYEIKTVVPDPYFEEKEDFEMPVTIWLGNMR